MKPKLDPVRESEILELSEDVANEASTSGKVCPLKICKEKNIKIVRGAYGTGAFDGMLAYRDRQWVVLCNTDNGNVQGSTRERFTIAHELGHYHIPEHRRQLMAGCPSHGSYAGAFDGADRIEELEADTFAANLLMPPSRFVPRIRALKETPMSGILRLRREFETSLESTSIQTLRHNGDLLMIAKWDNTSLKWHRKAESNFRTSGYISFKIRGISQLEHDCAISKALKDAEDKYDGKPHECVVPASYRFSSATGGMGRDALIREEAFRNGRFGVMAVYSRYPG